MTLKEILKVVRKRINFFILPLAGIFVSLLLILLIIIPQIRKIVEIQDKIKTSRARLTKLSVKLADLNGIDEGALSQQVAFALKALPGNKNMQKLMAVYNQIASESQVLVQNFDISPGEVATVSSSAANSFDLMAFKMKVTGDWDRILAFIFQFGETLPVTNIKTMRVSSNGSRADLQFSAETYFAQIPTSIGKVDAPISKLTEKEAKIFEKLTSMRDFEVAGMLEEANQPTNSSSAGRTDPFSL